jgi:hypothetical protein
MKVTELTQTRPTPFKHKVMKIPSGIGLIKGM